jgi:hypothetical protein
MKKKRLHISTLEKKVEDQWWHKLFKYEQKYVIDWYIKDNDKITSRIIRKRDEWKMCGSFWIRVCDGKKRTMENSQCGHVIRRGYYSCRRDLRNMFSVCPSCNVYWLQDHANAMTDKVIKEYWESIRDEMRQKRSMKKPDYRELKEINVNLKKVRDSIKNTCNDTVL